MKVKGTIVTSVQEYIKENFPNRYREWVESLSVESRAIHDKSIMPTEWYDYRTGLVLPTEAGARMFYGGDVQKLSWEIGRFNAEIGLKGIYKVFILIATPQFIMKRGGKILASFYRPSMLKVGEERPCGVDLQITEFPDPTLVAESRIGGWMEKALEICGLENISIRIKQSLLDGADKTIYEVNWE
ncbi:MAG: hypothetical protein MI975_09585 [Cytophagales bacterium]|nr:hypothetical protein [Cytophagales bacterium]